MKALIDLEQFFFTKTQIIFKCLYMNLKKFSHKLTHPIESSILSQGRVWAIKYKIFSYFPHLEPERKWGTYLKEKILWSSIHVCARGPHSFTDLLDSNLQCAMGTELKSVLTLLLRNEYTNLV